MISHSRLLAVLLALLAVPYLRAQTSPSAMRVLEVTGLSTSAPPAPPPLEDNGTGMLRVELAPGTRLVAGADGVLSLQHPGILRFRTRAPNGQEVVYVLLNGARPASAPPLDDPHPAPDSPMRHGEVRRLGIVRAGHALVESGEAGFMTIGVGLPELPSVPAMAAWTRLEPDSGGGWTLTQARPAPRYIPQPEELPRAAIRPPPEVIGATLEKLAPWLGAKVQWTVTVERGPRTRGKARP